MSCQSCDQSGGAASADESLLIPGVAGPPLPLLAVSVAGFTVLQLLVGVLVLAAIIRSARQTLSAPGRSSLATPFGGIPGAPLGYLLALEKDNTVPWAIANASYKQQQVNSDAT